MTDLMNIEALPITIEEVEKSLIGMSKVRAAGEDGIIVDLLKDEGFILLDKLAKW